VAAGSPRLQGVGAAVVAPTALSLIATTFPEGRPRNRAMGTYAAMSVGGAAVGLLAGGLLTSYLSWRWVFFVNVPIGIVVALMAPRALAESPRRHGRFDLPGAITGTLGLVALVYGLTSAATTPDGVSHWGDPKVLASLGAAVVLLASFLLIEARSPNALMPLRIFRNRNRSGAYLIMLCVGTALFGMFFFLTIFVQTVWAYSALKTGIAYLPMTAAIMAMAGVSTQLVPRIGARPLLLAGSAITTSGMFWLSRIGEHSSYADGLLGPMLVTAAGLGLLFMPAALVALSKVEDRDAGLASSLVNTGQQVGGSIGLALLGTVAWTVVADTARSSAAAARTAAIAAARAGHPGKTVPEGSGEAVRVTPSPATAGRSPHCRQHARAIRILGAPSAEDALVMHRVAANADGAQINHSGCALRSSPITLAPLAGLAAGRGLFGRAERYCRNTQRGGQHRQSGQVGQQRYQRSRENATSDERPARIDEGRPNGSTRSSSRVCTGSAVSGSRDTAASWPRYPGRRRSHGWSRRARPAWLRGTGRASFARLPGDHGRPVARAPAESRCPLRGELNRVPGPSVAMVG
jgi:EmrB/QacA subfamily drug resistance transporter